MKYRYTISRGKTLEVTSTTGCTQVFRDYVLLAVYADGYCEYWELPLCKHANISKVKPKTAPHHYKIICNQYIYYNNHVTKIYTLGIL